MTRPTPLAWAAYAIAVGVVVADQTLKFWLLDVFDLSGRLAKLAFATGEPRLPIFGPLHLSLVWNTGISFGVLNIGAEWTRWLLSAFALFVAVGLGVWARNIERPTLATAVGCIVGGAVGNLIDRLRLGAVTDFIDFSPWFPWVFNIADAAINVGAALLIWDLFLAPRKRAAA